MESAEAVSSLKLQLVAVGQWDVFVKRLRHFLDLSISSLKLGVLLTRQSAMAEGQSVTSVPFAQLPLRYFS